MKTPDEIKKGLECCPVCSKSCAYYNGVDCYAELHYDALALIKQLERERNAAVKALRGDCRECAHRGKWDVCTDCIYFCPFEDEGKKDNWQWRGPEVE